MCVQSFSEELLSELNVEIVFVTTSSGNYPFSDAFKNVTTRVSVLDSSIVSNYWSIES